MARQPAELKVISFITGIGAKSWDKEDVFVWDNCFFSRGRGDCRHIINIIVKETSSETGPSPPALVITRGDLIGFQT